MHSSPEEPLIDKPRFQFSIRSLLWIVTLLCLGMNTFGAGWGIFTFLVILWVLKVYQGGWRIFPPFMLLVLIGIHSIVPAVREAQLAAIRSTGLGLTKQLWLGIHNYQDSTGHFPPPRILGDDKTPLHSWRLDVLPLFDYQSYPQIDKKIPWDDPRNLHLYNSYYPHCFWSLRKLSAGYECNFLAIVDEETIWHPSETVTFKDIEDGASNTILFIEVQGRGVKWYEPCDLTMEEAIDILTGEVDQEFIEEGFWYSICYQGDGLMQRAVAIADGSVMMIGRIKDRETARALLTRAGGEELSKDWELFARTNKPIILGYQTNWLRILSLFGFIGLALLPFKGEKQLHQETVE